VHPLVSSSDVEEIWLSTSAGQNSNPVVVGLSVQEVGALGQKLLQIGMGIGGRARGDAMRAAKVGAGRR